jgi:hypothetical protein
MVPPLDSTFGEGRMQLPDLVAGLSAVPGCLGVETARTGSGKEVIFAWFADKAAVLRWYSGRAHQTTIKAVFPEYVPEGPLRHVRDDVGPIMVIASLTESAARPATGVELPISQIAIELYAPLDGGLHFGGRFAPEGVRLEHMRDYTAFVTRGPPETSRPPAND